jgi:hypothetical protein
VPGDVADLRTLPKSMGAHDRPCDINPTVLRQDDGDIVSEAFKSDR